jgi:hypothetical protein
MTKKTNLYNFGRDAFRVWLRKNPTLKFRTCDSGKCPLATFARKACGYKGAYVDSGEVKLGKTKRAAKRWEADFVGEVDMYIDRITGREAYRILNRVTRGRVR